MFGAGWTEMLIIGVVALVVIGPKDLPGVMARLGRMVKTVRRMGDEFQRELNKTTGLDQIADLRRSITEPLRQTSDEIMREFNRQTTTGVEPTGVMKPTDPNVESVYDQIAATSGLPMSTASATEAEPLPVPAEAAPVAAKPRRARKAKVVAVDEDVAPAKPKRRTARKTTGKVTSKASTAAPASAPVEATPIAAEPTSSAAVPASSPRRRAASAKKNGGPANNGDAASPPRRSRTRAAAKPTESVPPHLPAEEA